MQGIDIVSLGEADIPDLVALWTLCGLTRPWNDPAADARLALATEGATLLGARREDALVGSVMTGFDGHRGWVYYLAVAPDQRGQGTGSALMAAGEHWLRERGSPKIQLMVRGDNVSALGFYERIGYARQDVVVLGRRLDED